MFMEEPVFVYIKRNENLLYEADKEINSEHVRIFLKENGIESSQYIDRNPSNLIDLADDIIASGSEQVVFYVDDENIEVTEEIADSIKEIDDMIKIIWFGERFDLSNEIENVDALIDENFEVNILAEILEDEDVEFKSLEEIDFMSENNFGEVLIGTDSYRKDLKTVLKEIEKSSEEKVVLRYRDDELSFVKEVVENLSANEVNSKLELTLNFEDIIENEFDLIRSGCFSKVKTQYDMKKHDKNELDMLFNECIESTTSLAIDLKNVEENILNDLKPSFKRALEGGVIKLKDIGILDSEIDMEVVETLHEIDLNKELEIENMRETALKNGFMCYQTGTYPKNLLNDSTKHIEINSYDDLSNVDLENLREYMSINSAFVLNDVDCLEDEYYLCNQNILRRKNKKLEEYKNRFKEDKVYMSHTYNIKGVEADLKDISFDDIYHKKNLKVNIAPYSKIGSVEELTIATLDTKDDLDVFLSNIDHFVNKGFFKNEYECNTNFNIKNVCMWMTCEQCSLTKLPRFNLGGNGEILPCNKQAIEGLSINDERYRAKQKIAIHEEKQRVKRECSKCELNRQCSSCTMLPQWMEESYCDIRKRYPQTTNYLNVSNVLKFFRQNIEGFKQAKLEDIKISTRDCSHIYDGEVEGESYINDHSLLFIVNENPIIFNLLTNKMYSVSRDMAEMIEALIKGVSAQNLKNYIVEKYDTDEQTASQNVKTIQEMLISSKLGRKDLNI